MDYRFVTADVFTDRQFGGNQLAVFPKASGLTDAQMQSIAIEFNLSETVFVFPPADASNTRALRIFTPGGELPFAGHPTVGCAHVLAALGEVPLQGAETRIVLEEKVGPVPVLIRSDAGSPVFAQLSVARLPEIGPQPPTRATLAEIVGVSPQDILTGVTTPQAVSCGVPFLIVPLRDRAVLSAARVRMDPWQAVLSGYWAKDIYLFTRDAEQPEARIHARMFGPSMNILEDPATGSAAVALGGYLAAREHARSGRFSWVIEQGVDMGRPSVLHVEADKEDGAVTAVRVGGSTVLVTEGQLRIR